ncbi:MAG: sulfatase-like hydrolase/transferase [Planctomycetota bacterium]
MPNPPNILLIVSDDHRHSAMSCVDGPLADPVQTPHLDALAARGTRMTHAYHAGSWSAAVCMPSRAMLHSGRGPFDLPRDMAQVPEASLGTPAGDATLGGLLGQAGYRTHHIGKWHNNEEPFCRSFQSGEAVMIGGMPHDHFQTPMENWDGQALSPMFLSNCHGTDVFAEAARAFLYQHANADDDRPFFLSLAFTAPHDPRVTHPEYHTRFPIDQIELPPNFTPDPALRPDLLPIRDNLSLTLPRDPEAMKREIAGYYAMVEHLDHGIGRVLDQLDTTGLAEDTLVIYTADHGHAVGQHGLLAKQYSYDHSLRVPLLAAGPGIPKGRTCDALCYQHDLFPTLLHTAGITDTPTAFEDLTPCLTGQRDHHRPWVGCYYTDEWRTVSDGNTKLVQRLLPHDRGFTRFDLERDPWETTPIATGPDDPLHAALTDWQQWSGDPLGSA